MPIVMPGIAGAVEQILGRPVRILEEQQIRRRPALLVAPDVGERMGVVAVGDVRHRRREWRGAPPRPPRASPRAPSPPPRRSPAPARPAAACAWRRSYLSRLAITGTRLRLAPPSRVETDLPAALPAMSQSAMSTAASAFSTVPARPKLAKRLRVARFSASRSVDRLAEIGRRDRVADGGEQRPLHGRPQRQALAIAHRARLRVVTRASVRQKDRRWPRNAQSDGLDLSMIMTCLRV